MIEAATQFDQFTHTTNKPLIEDPIEWFSDLLRRKPNEASAVWASRVLESWVPLFNGLQAALYWIVYAENEQQLRLLSSYACDSQYLRSTLRLGEGLVGQSARSNRLIYLDDRSRFRPTTTTNLSAIQPAAYLVAPLVYDQVVEGVVEMTLINRLTEEQIVHLRRMGAQLGASLRTLRNEEVTRELYAQMQLKNEELIAQDEEMRQNLEEMQATQEELRRTKEELERRQQQFELIASNIPGALVQLHEIPKQNAKIIRYASSRFLEWVGKTSTEVIGQDFFNFLEIHPEDIERFVQEDEQSLQGGDFVIEMRNKSEVMPEFRWFQYRGVVRPLGDGSFLTEMFMDDIHEQKLQEQELALKTAVFTHSNDSIWILDGITIIDCNEASLRLFDCESREELIGTSYTKWSPEFQSDGNSSSKLIIACIHKAMSEGFAEFDWLFKRSSGETFECDVKLNRIVVGSKTFLSASHRDISSRKLQEREIAALRNLYRTFLNQLDQAVFIIDSQGSPFFANRRAIELLGKGLEPNAGQDDLAKVYPAYKLGTTTYYPTEELPIVRALAGEDTTIDDMEIETPAGRKRIRVHGFPIRDESQKIKYAMCTFEELGS